MWIRLVRAQGLTSSKIMRVVDRFRVEDLPGVEQAPGYLGVALGENHIGGSIGSVAFWESEQAMLDTERLSERARERALSSLENPEPMLVDRFEATFTTRLAALADQQRPCMRLVRFTGLTRESIELASECYCGDAPRLLREAVGIEGFALGANHAVGSLIVISFWSSQRAMRETERLSAQIRDQVSEAVPEDPLADRWALVDRFEITVASRLERLATVRDDVAYAPA